MLGDAVRYEASGADEGHTVVDLYSGILNSLGRYSRPAEVDDFKRLALEVTVLPIRCRGVHVPDLGERALVAVSRDDLLSEGIQRYTLEVVPGVRDDLGRRT